MNLNIPQFADRAKLFDWLVANKQLLIAQKKSTIKHADAFSGSLAFILDDDKTIVDKAELIPATVTKIKVRSIINTTKLFDSHGDVHIDQLWNKSIKEAKENYLVDQHDFTYGGIISDNVKVMTKQLTWHELGYNYEGQTQALVYDSIIDKEDMGARAKEDEMFDKYRKGRVKQHSVGMRYVNMLFAVNDDRYKEEFEVWNKYFDLIANKEDALSNGYFWPVLEAKNIEGSAVLKGSNFVTPTYSVEAKTGADIITPEPTKVTLKASDLVNMYNLKL